ncbi:hypothetical protein HH214_17415 [Mucilaginibacter robiniae]|uniref:Uncharacterized protein n=1 Tax=Mucilaginibacter robiniae TaxID=2728022 RepID=A0A7L5E6W6_9SPHI|nr:hypothetical protein [Mucilaginibacter robiniae]QJD97524.1 hypothetical protein HH214_17415 [Mucilaginibacter robiniae]
MLFLAIFILTLAASLLLPWWVVAIIAFAAALFAGTRPAQAFWSGFGAVFIAWVVLALFNSIPNHNMLAARVATLFHLPHWSLLLFITALLGGLVGGMAALSGLLVKQVFKG